MTEGNIRHWEIGHLKLRPEVVWSMALSSLRVRLFRSFLTCLTITVATAFMMYLLTMPREAEAAEQQSWYLMLTLALIVAAAGVLNAMLMSVSQRYREIGTIKCLGALDSMVLYSVLVEAAMLGLVGAVAGVFVGGIISVLLGLVGHGGKVFQQLELGALGFKVLFVFFVGMVLTTLGASIPAWVAAKMPPVEAMRGEK
jgi:ABC-type antimicrobial peptide transport system permease subunit